MQANMATNRDTMGGNMTTTFNPMEPAACEAETHPHFIYRQSNAYWLYNVKTGVAHQVEQPRAWLSNAERIAMALRQIEAS
jgi:hypothetical protein